jgi:hypothetical protein
MNRDGLPIRSAGFEALAGDFADCDHPSYFPAQKSQFLRKVEL